MKKTIILLLALLVTAETYAITPVRKEINRIMSEHTYLGETVITTQPRNKMRNDATIGEHFMGTSQIHIAQDLRVEKVCYVLFHEYGHYVYDNLSDRKKRQWVIIVKNNPVAPTEYGYKNHLEAFAEFYAIAKGCPRLRSYYYDSLDSRNYEFVKSIASRTADKKTRNKLD